MAGATQAGVRGEPLTRQLLTFGALLRGETRSGEGWNWCNSASTIRMRGGTVERHPSLRLIISGGNRCPR